VSSSYFDEKVNSNQNEEAVNTYLQKGNNALASGNLHSAGRSYEACLRLDPNQRYCLINYASALVDLNGEEDDESIKQQRTKKAQDMLKHVLSLHPRDGDAAFNLALLLQDSSTSDEVTREAARLYEIAVEAADNDGEERWDALANMAAAKQEVGEFMGRYGARRAYERAIVLLEKIAQDNEAYLNQGGTFEEGEQQHLQAELHAINEYLSKLYYGYGTVLSELSDSDCQKLQHVSEESLLIDWVEPFVKGSGTQKENGKDEASPNLVCKMNAINALRLAVDLNPSNVVAEHMLAAMTEGQVDSGRASNEFVSALFDDFADTFDAKLEALGYKVPGLVGDAAKELLATSGQSSYRSALDAGCGTGLAGRYLRPLVTGPLVGIDLSKKMLDLAAKCTLTKGCGLKDEDAADGDIEGDKPLYDHLASLDLETTKLEDLDAGVGFDIIVAADVFVYFGDLQKLLNNFAKLSDRSGEHGAFLIFSCERIEEEEDSMWKLQKSGRYAHSKSYVVNTAANAGWELVGYDEITPRYEKGEAVKGHLFRFSLGKDQDVKEEL
jgi:predicted TPR repeat methyltransferase